MFYKRNIPIFLLTLYSSAGFANGIQLGQPFYRGTGCPNGSVAPLLMPDGETVSVVFDRNRAEVGGSIGPTGATGATGATEVQQNCDLIIPIHVPEGSSISLSGLSYAGYTKLPAGGFSKLTMNVSLGDQWEPPITRGYSGPFEHDFTCSMPAQSPRWSPCGKEVNLTISSKLYVKTTRSDELAFIALGETVRPGTSFRVQSKTCE